MDRERPDVPPANLPPQRGDSSATRISKHVVEPKPKAGSSVRKPAVSEPQAPSHEQKTVISKRPPASSPPPMLRPSGPFEIGRILEGESLGHYQLEEFIGGGGMGAVFRALDTELGRTVAVKVVASDETDEDTLRRFKNEAQSAARLDHPNIARVYYVGQDKGWNYIVFEYIEGVNIRDLVSHKGPLPLNEAIHYTLQAAEALSHASQRDVVHRDIKPSNLLVMPTGHLKLVDMGLARLQMVQTSQQDLTATGVTLGTFDYISPEQARDPRRSDVRSDLYSLGCTLYYMLTGLPPFPDGTVLQKLLNHNSEAPPDPRQFRPDLPEELTTVLHKLLAKRPNDRYQTPDELIAQLIHVASTLGLPCAERSGTVRIATAVSPIAVWKRWLPIVAPLAVLALIVIAADWLDGADSRAVLPPLTYTPAVSRPALPEPMPPESPTPFRPKAIEPSVSPDDREPERVVPPPTPPAAPTPPPVETASPPAPEANKVLVVAKAGDMPPGSTDTVSSLAAALKLASKTPAIEAIELRVKDELLEEPCSFAGRNLTIRAATGYRPLVVFRPVRETDSPDAMIQLSGGGEVLWQDIDLRLEAPRGATWTLFRLDQLQSLELRHCTLTIRNESENADYASFFELTSNGPKATMAPPLVKLGRCLVRGQASVVRLREVFPMRLQWEQGLLVVSGRLLETSGATVKPKWVDGRVDVNLQNITARVDRGLCLMDSNPSAPHQIMLVTNCNLSNIWTRDGAPLIELRGGDDAATIKRRLNITGRANFYPTTYLRIVSPAGTEDINGGDAEATANWYDGKRDQPTAMVLWNADPFNAPVDGQTKADYLLLKTDTNPAWKTSENMGAAGFDPDLLPNPTEP